MYLKLIAVGVTLVSLAVASEIAPLGTYTPRERGHWAFVKRATPAAPTFSLASDKAWAKSPVDAFILQRLKKEGLKPSPQAGRATLIHRVSPRTMITFDTLDPITLTTASRRMKMGIARSASVKRIKIWSRALPK